MQPLISIIIRTKNEERWITQVLREVFAQDYKNIEVIIVDSESIDATLEKIKQFPIHKLITCKDYLPGKALNMGIREANGDYVVSLSGHCIPTSNQWLSNLIKNLNDPLVVGVYGRQEAMSFTTNSDKRDLALVFGLDRRVQQKDSFFHNANSLIRKDIWKEIPFDEEVTNIEDRIWAQKVLQKGYKIIYEPEASVYHYHGIHQNGDAVRCENVVRILENLNSEYKYKSIDMEKLNVVAFIPVRGPIQYLNKKPLLAYTIIRALESKYIKRTIITTDNLELADVAKKLGAEVPFIRDSSLSEEHIDLVKVLQYSLKRTEELKIFPDVVVSLEVTFPFRPKGLLDEMILQFAQHGFDSVIAAKRENKSIWKERAEGIVRLDEDIIPRKFKDPTFIGLKGIGCVTLPEFLRQGKLLGYKIGIYEINNPYVNIEVRSKKDFEMASFLIDRWFSK